MRKIKSKPCVLTMEHVKNYPEKLAKILKSKHFNRLPCCWVPNTNKINCLQLRTLLEELIKEGDVSRRRREEEYRLELTQLSFTHAHSAVKVYTQVNIQATIYKVQQRAFLWSCVSLLFQFKFFRHVESKFKILGLKQQLSQCNEQN